MAPHVVALNGDPTLIDRLAIDFQVVT